MASFFSLQFFSLFVNEHRAFDRHVFFSYMVGVLGFEPRTSSLSGTRSNQLSYTPNRASRYDGNPVYLGGA